MVTNALRVDPDGGIQLLEIDASTSETRAAAMVEQIGCRMYTVVALPGNVDLWVDDEGIDTKPINRELTRMSRISVPEQSDLAGVGLFLGVDPETGESQGLTRREVERVLNWWIVTVKFDLIDI
ncbi:DUF3846 domain-containing protein [Agreia sp. COWG]|uniref:DUF3846 domain-containing protein n=1 Tax=Agreia sp. COWG TaxID=2773266 RepID=UPI001926F372|nr:DUF3846 domain-containing protein [Agreia sp. COWG]CAD6016206.1 conserved protein of unknown function [Agreia sp. COWG]